MDSLPEDQGANSSVEEDEANTVYEKEGNSGS